jgi:hypothetical protein
MPWMAFRKYSMGTHQTITLGFVHVQRLIIYAAFTSSALEFAR